MKSSKKKTLSGSNIDIALFGEIHAKPEILETAVPKMTTTALLELLMAIEAKELPPAALKHFLKGITLHQFYDLITSHHTIPQSILNATQTEELQEFLLKISVDLESVMKETDIRLYEYKKAIDGLDITEATSDDMERVDNGLAWKKKLFATTSKSYSKHSLLPGIVGDPKSSNA